jgi:hypothetical protein
MRHDHSVNIRSGSNDHVRGHLEPQRDGGVGILSDGQIDEGHLGGVGNSESVGDLKDPGGIWVAPAVEEHFSSKAQSHTACVHSRIEGSATNVTRNESIGCATGGVIVSDRQITLSS